MIVALQIAAIILLAGAVVLGVGVWPDVVASVRRELEWWRIRRELERHEQKFPVPDVTRRGKR